jgi:hypothetical protein
MLRGLVMLKALFAGFLALTIGVSAFGGRAAAASPGDEFKPRVVIPTERGCLGQPLSECLASLKPYMLPEEQKRLEHGVAALDETDVNGNPAHRDRKLSTNLIGIGELYTLPTPLQISVSPENIVTEVEISVRPRLTVAKTDSDYFAAGLYGLTLLAVGKRCSLLEAPGDLHRFFHNSVLPKLAILHEPRDRDENRRRSFYHTATPWVQLRDASIRFATASTYTREILNREKYQGDFSRSVLIFK